LRAKTRPPPRKLASDPRGPKIEVANPRDPTHAPETTFVNYDRYIKIEADFDPTLDEYFNVPTNKQRVDLDDRIWGILSEHGLFSAIKELRRKFQSGKALKRAEQAGNDDVEQPPENAMANTAKMAAKPSEEVVARRLAEGARRLEQEAEKRAHETGKPVQQAKREIEAELGGRAYKVARRAVPGGNFFDVEQIGGTKVLWINTATRFFREVYAAPDSTHSMRWALDVLLFSIGERILDAQDGLRDTYAHEVPEWSRKLEYALGQLATLAAARTADDTDQEEAAKEIETQPAE
jgi:hypothetical protein